VGSTIQAILASGSVIVRDVVLDAEASKWAAVIVRATNEREGNREWAEWHYLTYLTPLLRSDLERLSHFPCLPSAEWGSVPSVSEQETRAEPSLRS
jgi:hypothetical protein